MSRVALRFCHHHLDIFHHAESCEIFRCRPKGDWTDREPPQNAPPVGRVSRDIAFDKTRAIATARARIVSGSSAEPDSRHPRRGKGTTRDICHRRARAGLWKNLMKLLISHAPRVNPPRWPVLVLLFAALGELQGVSAYDFSGCCGSKLKHWFDFSDSSVYGTSAQSTISSFSDKLGNSASHTMRGNVEYVPDVQNGLGAMFIDRNTFGCLQRTLRCLRVMRLRKSAVDANFEMGTSSR